MKAPPKHQVGKFPFLKNEPSLLIKHNTNVYKEPVDEHQEQGSNNQPDSAPVSTESEVFIEVTVTDLPSSPDFKQIELLSTVNTSHWISFSGECIGEYEHTQIVWSRRNIIYYGNIAWYQSLIAPE